MILEYSGPKPYRDLETGSRSLKSTLWLIRVFRTGVISSDLFLPVRTQVAAVSCSFWSVISKEHFSSRVCKTKGSKLVSIERPICFLVSYQVRARPAWLRPFAGNLPTALPPRGLHLALYFNQAALEYKCCLWQVCLLMAANLLNLYKCTFKSFLCF